MTITADARSSASTAAGRPTSSRPSDDAPRTDVVSPYGKHRAPPVIRTAERRRPTPGARSPTRLGPASTRPQLRIAASPRPPCGHVSLPGSSTSLSDRSCGGA